MFKGFTKETGDFMWELKFNNERPWFLEHKARFEECVNTPFRELARDTFELLQKRFPEFEAELHISRIYRDARRLHGAGPYKEHLWFSIKKDQKLLYGPMFWFEVGASDYAYGMGYYTASPAELESFRASIDANPARFERIAAALSRCKELEPDCELYARPKGDRGELINPWYNSRRMGMQVRRDFGGAVLSPELPQILVDTYAQLMPLYEYFTKFCRVEENTHEQN